MVRDRDGRPPKRTPWQCTASVCVVGVHCLGVSRSMECDLLSVLSIYSRIILRVFIVYRLLVGFLYV